MKMPRAPRHLWDVLGPAAVTHHRFTSAVQFIKQTHMFLLFAIFQSRGGIAGVLTPRRWCKSDVHVMQSRALWPCLAVLRATRHTASVWVDVLMRYPAGPAPPLLLWRSWTNALGRLILSRMFNTLVIFIWIIIYTNVRCFRYDLRVK